MGKTLYFDCFSGASGDMILGALLDAGVPLEALRGALGSLAIDHGVLSADRVLRAGISATKFRLLEPAHAAHGERRLANSRAGLRSYAQRRHDAHATCGGHDRVRPRSDPDLLSAPGSNLESRVRRALSAQAEPDHHSLADIEGYIGRSALSPAGKARAVSLFHRLAEAEAAIHDMPLDRIHLHEVGAIDSIVDIVGAVFAMEWLGADRIVSSPLNVGSGTVTCAHGEFPVPAPATVRLLKGAPIYCAGRGHRADDADRGAAHHRLCSELRSDAGDARQRRSAMAPATRTSPVIRTCCASWSGSRTTSSRSSGLSRWSARSTT